jgi:hypothetical protein
MSWSAEQFYKVLEGLLFMKIIIIIIIIIARMDPV